MASLLASSPIGRFLLRGKGRTAIGIDVGARSVKAVQMERRRGGKTTVVAATVRPRAMADGATAPAAVTPEEAAALAAALAASGFTGQRITLAAPAESVLIAPLDLPPKSSQAPLDQLARMEVARNFRCAPDSFEMAWWEMPTGIRAGRGTHAMGVALPHARADALLDAFEHPGLEVDAIETEQTALVRACRPALFDKGVTAILDIDWGPSTLSFVHGGVLSFSRRIPEGAVGPLHASCCKTLGIEADVADYLLGEVGLGAAGAETPGDGLGTIEMPEEGVRIIAWYVDTLIKELSLSFSYAAHQYPDAAVGKLLLVGGGAGMAGLTERISSVVGIETVRVAPVDVAACEPSLLALCSSPSMTLALGLAERELE